MDTDKAIEEMAERVIATVECAEDSEPETASEAMEPRLDHLRQLYYTRELEIEEIESVQNAVDFAGLIDHKQRRLRPAGDSEEINGATKAEWAVFVEKTVDNLNSFGEIWEKVKAPTI
jgi:hypothetical protein